jgi:hypothetical protein
MAVSATLLRAPFAHLSAECAGILDVSTVSRHCTDAELTKLETLMAANRAIIVARLGRHSLDTLLAPQVAFLAGLDTLAIGFGHLRHEGSPFLTIFSSLPQISACERATCLLNQTSIAKVSKVNDGVAKLFE